MPRCLIRDTVLTQPAVPRAVHTVCERSAGAAATNKQPFGYLVIDYKQIEFDVRQAEI